MHSNQPIDSNPRPARDAADAAEHRAHTVYVDWADLEAKLTAKPRRDQPAQDSGEPTPRRRRVITNADAQTQNLRRNVQDAAKTVLAWVANITNDEDGQGTAINDILDRCLKPGPDIERVNYTAMADEIGKTMGVALSPKRIKTAIDHLRKQNTNRQATMATDPLKNKLDSLHEALGANFTSLIDQDDDAHRGLQRETALQILGAVRVAAGHLIENHYGEGIPNQVDIDALESTFLDFVRDAVGENSNEDDSACTDQLKADLQQLLIVLCDYDASSEMNMQLVVKGARVVADLTGPDSLPGIIAQLNVLVTGRYLIDSELYYCEMMRLAEQAALLHQDPGTKQLLTYARRLDESERIPSPLRASSFCLNNAATHVFERVFTGELQPQQDWFAKAQFCLQTMQQQDGGFRLIKTTQLVHDATLAKITGDDAALEARFTSMKTDQALALIEDLIRYDNCAQIVEQVKQAAFRAKPELKALLIHL